MNFNQLIKGIFKSGGKLKYLKVHPFSPKSGRRGKSRGTGITRKSYNFKKVKTRRKIANRSRRINRKMR